MYTGWEKIQTPEMSNAAPLRHSLPGLTSMPTGSRASSPAVTETIGSGETADNSFLVSVASLCHLTRLAALSACYSHAEAQDAA